MYQRRRLVVNATGQQCRLGAMSTSSLPEVWLRGAVEGYPANCSRSYTR